MLAVLEVFDYFMVALIVSLFAGGGIAAYRLTKPSDRARLLRLEAKVDAILANLGIVYQDPAIGGLSAEVRALADDPKQKIQAIKVHREQTGMGLKEAKDAVEAYIEGRQ